MKINIRESDEGNVEGKESYTYLCAFVCSFVWQQLHIKTTDWIFIQISLETNFGQGNQQQF